MKNIILLISILCVGYFAFPKNIFAADTNSPVPKGPADVNNIKKTDKTADANSINLSVKSADSNEAVDVNAVEDSNRILGELKKDLTDIDKDGQKEIKEWTREGGEKRTAASVVLENKTAIAKSAQEQVIKELNFLKTVAVGEGAKKTAAAIDALLADRKVRFEKMIAQMKEDASRLKEREKSQVRTPRAREGSVTPDSPSMEEKRKKREEAIKRREERLKKTVTQDANSQQNASENN